MRPYWRDGGHDIVGYRPAARRRCRKARSNPSGRPPARARDGRCRPACPVSPGGRRRARRRSRGAAAHPLGRSRGRPRLLVSRCGGRGTPGAPSRNDGRRRGGERAPQPFERGTGDRLEHVIDRGCRRGLDTEPETAVDEDDPRDPLGVAGGAGDGDEPAHGVPDDGCVLAPMRSRAATRSSACASMPNGPMIDALAPRPLESGATNVPRPSSAASAPASSAQRRWLAVTPWAATTGSPRPHRATRSTPPVTGTSSSWGPLAAQQAVSRQGRLSAGHDRDPAELGAESRGLSAVSEQARAGYRRPSCAAVWFRPSRLAGWRSAPMTGSPAPTPPRRTRWSQPVGLSQVPDRGNGGLAMVVGWRLPSVA
jgi:hypothetical protein